MIKKLYRTIGLGFKCVLPSGLFQFKNLVKSVFVRSFYAIFRMMCCEKIFRIAIYEVFRTFFVRFFPWSRRTIRFSKTSMNRDRNSTQPWSIAISCWEMDKKTILMRYYSHPNILVYNGAVVTHVFMTHFNHMELFHIWKLFRDEYWLRLVFLNVSFVYEN